MPAEIGLINKRWVLSWLLRVATGAERIDTSPRHVILPIKISEQDSHADNNHCTNNSEKSSSNINSWPCLFLCLFRDAQFLSIAERAMYLKLWHGPIIQIPHDSLQLFLLSPEYAARNIVYCKAAPQFPKSSHFFFASKMPIKTTLSFL